jgi:hypothetical protein
MASASRQWSPPAIAVKLACAAGVLGYFLYFAFDGTRVKWAADDPMNLYTYWRLGIWKVLWSNLAFFDGSYRPMGGLFYLPIYFFAHLNPLPCRIVLVCLLGFNAFLVYRFARLLGASERVSGLAALATCVHGSMADLIYQTSALYDILCFTFFFLAFNAYLRIRGPGRALRIRDAALVLALYIAATNSKEMAVTFPALLCLYELLYHPPQQWRRPVLVRWVVSACWPGMVAGGLTAAFLYGKSHGPDPLTATESYRPVLSFVRWMNANVNYTGAMFRAAGEFNWATAPILWLVLFYLAWRRKRPHLQFAWLFILIGTLPISFIPQRAGSCLYLPLVGWALFAATVASDLIELLAREPWLARLPRWACECVWTILPVALFFQWTAANLKDAPRIFREIQAPTWRVISDMNRLNLHPPHGSRIVILNSAPFPGFDVFFMTSLWWNDKTLEIHTEPDPAKADVPSFDYVLRFENGRLAIVKAPPRESGTPGSARESSGPSPPVAKRPRRWPGGRAGRGALKPSARYAIATSWFAATATRAAHPRGVGTRACRAETHLGAGAGSAG